MSSVCELCAAERTCLAELNGIALCTACFARQVKKMIRWRSTGTEEIDSRNQQEQAFNFESDPDQVVADRKSDGGIIGGSAVYGNAISA
ncbi:MAG: hypothetical protein ACREAQ_02305 [Nitrososphaera sp.]